MYMNGHGITIFNERKQDTFLDMARHFMIILKFCKTMKKSARKYNIGNINADLITLIVKTGRLPLYSVGNTK